MSDDDFQQIVDINDDLSINLSNEKHQPSACFKKELFGNEFSFSFVSHVGDNPDTVFPVKMLGLSQCSANNIQLVSLFTAKVLTSPQDRINVLHKIGLEMVMRVIDD
jgi:hypothetical protein